MEIACLLLASGCRSSGKATGSNCREHLRPKGLWGPNFRQVGIAFISSTPQSLPTFLQRWFLSCIIDLAVFLGAIGDVGCVRPCICNRWRSSNAFTPFPCFCYNKCNYG